MHMVSKVGIGDLASASILPNELIHSCLSPQGPEGDRQVTNYTRALRERHS